MKQWLIFTTVILSLIAIIVFAITLGSVPISLAEVIQALVRQGEELNQTIVWDLRLPRIVLGVLAAAVKPIPNRIHFNDSPKLIAISSPKLKTLRNLAKAIATKIPKVT